LKFVGMNLAKKYGITINDTIPAYLLGKRVWKIEIIIDIILF
jgi:hypothetical protein